MDVLFRGSTVESRDIGHHCNHTWQHCLHSALLWNSWSPATQSGQSPDHRSQLDREYDELRLSSSPQTRARIRVLKGHQHLEHDCSGELAACGVRRLPLLT